jgi:hypothetical protein
MLQQSNQGSLRPPPKQAKGETLSSLALAFPYFQRSGPEPDHNVCADEVVRSSSARVSLTLPLSHSLYEFPRCHSQDSFPILLKAIGYSLLLEDFSSAPYLELDGGGKVGEVGYRSDRWSVPAPARPPYHPCVPCATAAHLN